MHDDFCRNTRWRRWTVVVLYKELQTRHSHTNAARVNRKIKLGRPSTIAIRVPNTCAQCLSSHKKFKEMRDHRIVSVSEVPRHGSVKQPTVHGVKCGCNQNFVQIYCEDHNDVICGACHTVKHRKCETMAIRNKCAQSGGYKPGLILKTAKLLGADIENLKRKGQEEKCSIAKMTEESKSHTQTFRSKLNELLDTMERNLLKDINEVRNKHDETVDHQIDSLTTTSQMLQRDYKILEDLEKNGTKEAVFAAEIKISKSLKEYETVLLDITKEVPNCSVYFEKNMELETMLKETNLGKMKSSSRREPSPKLLPHDRRYVHSIILDKKIVSSSKANLNQSAGEKSDVSMDVPSY